MLWWEGDQIGVFITGLTISILMGKGVTGWGKLFFWLMPIIPVYIYSKYKVKYPRGFFRHCLYFVGFMKITGYPEFFDKKFIE